MTHTALAAVRLAKAVAKSRRGYLLLGTLKRAMSRYRNTLHRKITPAAGIQSYALRYAYTHDRIDALGGRPQPARGARGGLS